MVEDRPNFGATPSGPAPTIIPETADGVVASDQANQQIDNAQVPPDSLWQPGDPNSLPEPGKNPDGTPTVNPHGSQPQGDPTAQFFGDGNKPSKEELDQQRQAEHEQRLAEKETAELNFDLMREDLLKLSDADLENHIKIIPHVNAEKERRALERNARQSLHGSIDDLGKR